MWLASQLLFFGQAQKPTPGLLCYCPLAFVARTAISFHCFVVYVLVYNPVLSNWRLMDTQKIKVSSATLKPHSQVRNPTQEINHNTIQADLINF